MAIFSIIFISGYTIARFFLNDLGGLYMLKRIIFAVILAAAFENYVFLAPIIIAEILFMIARFFIEYP